MLREASQRVDSCIASLTQVGVAGRLAYEPRIVDLASLALHFLIFNMITAMLINVRLLFFCLRHSGQ